MAGALSNDVVLAAHTSATLIIQMGLSNLNEIVSVFSHHGKDNTPVAIIQNATMESQRSVIGTVNTIASLAEVSGIKAPAVIVIGDVVRYAALTQQRIKETQLITHYQ